MPRKLLVLFAAIACLAIPAFAQEASTSDVYACAAQSDDTARLACYDAAVGRLKAAEDAGEVTTISRSDVEKVRRDSFGFSIPSLPKLAMPKMGNGKADKIERITNPIKSVSKGAGGDLLIRLENGQIWRKIDNKPVRVSKKRPPKIATIKTAALGSFRMKLDEGPMFRVTREK